MNEQQALKFSMYGALGFAIFALILGVLLGSDVIVFDGLYSMIGMLLSLVSLIAARQVEKDPDHRFPFGRAALEPIVVLMQAAALFVFCVFALSDAVRSILDGGSELSPLHGILYALAAAVGCLIWWLWIRRAGRRLQSDLVTVEAEYWKLDMLLSVAVLVGFVIALGLTRTAYAAYAPYIDPLMVVMASLVFIVTPIRMLKDSLREIVMMAPDKTLHQSIQERVNQVCRNHALAAATTRIAKIGRELVLEVESLQPSGEMTVAQLDVIRKDLERHLSDLPYDLWLTLSVTADKRYYQEEAF